MDFQLLENSKLFLLENNTFVNNTGTAMITFDTASYSVLHNYPQLLSNYFDNSETQYNVQCLLVFRGPSGGINATYNYWGSIDSSDIESQLFHAFDDSTKVTINYSPWFNASMEVHAIDESVHPLRLKDNTYGGVLQHD